VVATEASTSIGSTVLVILLCSVDNCSTQIQCTGAGIWVFERGVLEGTARGRFNYCGLHSKQSTTRSRQNLGLLCFFGYIPMTTLLEVV
jgi:hypothetical protein